jgi:diacylglycerol kinase (ATP)
MTHLVRSILVIHNPVAGRRRRRKLLRLLKLLEGRDHTVRVCLTRQAGDAHEAARDARQTDLIIAAGGDGTVNEVVEGLCARPEGVTSPSIGFLPLGTANVLAWELNLPRDPAGLVRLVEKHDTCTVQPGLLNGRHFFLMAGTGLDARAVAAVRLAAKRVLGGAAYGLAALRVLRQTPPDYTITVDGEVHQARNVIVTLARCYAGPFTLTRRTYLGKGEMQVVLLQQYGVTALLRYTVALALGRLEQLSDVTVRTGHRIRIEGPAGDPVQLDGDIAASLPVSITLDQRKVKFMIPRR